MNMELVQCKRQLINSPNIPAVMSCQKLEPFPTVRALFYLFKMNFLVRSQRIFRVGYEATEITFVNLSCMNLYVYIRSNSLMRYNIHRCGAILPLKCEVCITKSISLKSIIVPLEGGNVLFFHTHKGGILFSHE